MTTIKESSRKDWASGDTTEHIKLGALQRIADATELMAKRYSDLIAERDRFARSAENWRAAAERRALSIRALKGQITKLRNKQRTTAQEGPKQ